MAKRKKDIATLMEDLEQRINEVTAEFSFIAVNSKRYTRERDIESGYSKMYKLTLELKPVAHIIEKQHPKIYKLMDMLIEYYKHKNDQEDTDNKERIIQALQEKDRNGNTGTDITA